MAVFNHVVFPHRFSDLKYLASLALPIEVGLQWTPSKPSERIGIWMERIVAEGKMMEDGELGEEMWQLALSPVVCVFIDFSIYLYMECPQSYTCIYMGE